MGFGATWDLFFASEDSYEKADSTFEGAASRTRKGDDAGCSAPGGLVPRSAHRRCYRAVCSRNTVLAGRYSVGCTRPAQSDFYDTAAGLLVNCGHSLPAPGREIHQVGLCRESVSIRGHCRTGLTIHSCIFLSAI